MLEEQKYQHEGSARVAWLETVYQFFNEEIFNKECPFGANISWGWPSRSPKKAHGQASELLKNANSEFLITISPIIDNTTEILDTLVHEMVHLAVGCEHGHRKAFSQLAKKVGLEKPWSASTPSEELKDLFKRVVIKFGDIPSGHYKFNEQKKKQTTRLRLYTCECEIKIRVASDDLDVTCNKCKSVFTKQATSNEVKP
jgi:hypothetical protein